MPENEDQTVPEAGIQAPVESAREQFERERMTRRQALKKFGMTSAMATFALFSVDDLARIVGKAMQQRAGDNKVAAQIAQEFQQAGIALADISNALPYKEYGMHCKGNTNTYGKASTCADCVKLGCDADYPSGTSAEKCVTAAEGYC